MEKRRSIGSLRLTAASYRRPPLLSRRKDWGCLLAQEPLGYDGPTSFTITMDPIAETGRISAALDTLLQQRILILDGAMGTMIQQRKLDEAAFRGERFRDWKRDVRGHNDLLNLTQP